MKNRQRQKDTLFSILIFCSAFAVNLLIQKLFTTQTLVPMIFVFGVFLISLKTHGYCYGITSAIVSVFAVNFAFTYPYYVFDFFVGESILSAVIMLAVAVFTSTLNSRIRDQEKLRTENEKERMRGNLLRAISHDLRTPLTSIYGSSSTLISKYDALPKEQQLKLLGEIQEDSEWLIRMVENLLSVTRIDGAKVEVVKTPTVLDELIDSVLMKFSKKYPNQKVITQIPEEFVDILSAVIMLAVAVFTSTLNSRIRDQEKLRTENEKERMRGNLLRAISHDLRTPLTSIYGSSSTLISKYDALPKEQQLKLLGEIQEDSEWLIRMVENLLSVTRIDGAKVEVVKTPTVLDELIDSVLMKFSKKYPNQKVITQIPEEFVDIPMDSLLIEQVLLNLLENAVFHAKGMTELTLSVSLVGDKAVFEVADNGCGLPDDALQKIFTGSYEKSAAPVDGTRSNMGIGLSVCAAIVKAHGSEITAENRKGGGAVFRFALERGGEDDGQ